MIIDIMPIRMIQAEMVRKVLISVPLILSLLDFYFMMMYVNDILISQAIL